MPDINATEVRKSFFEMVKDAITSHKIFHIHHRDGDVVLMS